MRWKTEIFKSKRRLKRERNANNSDSHGPIGSRRALRRASFGSRPCKLNGGMTDEVSRIDHAGNLSCHKEISARAALNRLFRILPVDIREFLLATCCSLSLSLRAQPPPRVYSHGYVSAVPRHPGPRVRECIQYFKISSSLCHLRNRAILSNCVSNKPRKKSRHCIQGAHLTPSVFIRFLPRVYEIFILGK